jgi:glycerate 2-kinase
MSAESLHELALRIWSAGVAAVDSQTLVEQAIRWTPTGWQFGRSPSTAWNGRGSVLVLGAGKAGAGMAAGAEAVLAQRLGTRLSGWINVPADCVRALPHIHLHAGRPGGSNEPTIAGMEGAREILRRASQQTEDDLTLVLLSGGASALLPLPVEQIDLPDKLAVTRLLASRGAPIQDLNRVRSVLSQIKGGGLARAVPAGRIITLVISDVVGDPLDVIGSGPTVDQKVTREHARNILLEFAPEAEWPPRVVQFLMTVEQPRSAVRVAVEHHIIGNNETAVQAAAAEARAIGFDVLTMETQRTGDAAEEGRRLAAWCRAQTPHRVGSRGCCLISGGEPTVTLNSGGGNGRGGRNQELIVAAIACQPDDSWQNRCLVSGGTDGEDGPTDAAGGWVDQQVMRRVRDLALDGSAALQHHNTYPFLQQAGGLLKTGPTHTNVMDLRVAVVES